MSKKIEWVITYDPSEVDERAYMLFSEIDGQRHVAAARFFKTEAEARALFAFHKEMVRRKKEEGGKQKEIFREELDG